MKVAILGFGWQGLSAYNYYRAQGAQLSVCDKSQQLNNAPEGVELRLGDDYLKHLDQFDLLIRTPALPPEEIAKANPDLPDILERVTTASNEFFAQVKTPIIAVTGTKGKGTTCMLAQAILEEAGLSVSLVGNMGIAPLDKVEEARAADIVVFEIASFQSLDLRRSPQVGVCLKMVAEHLDWHHDYQDYLRSKAQLFAYQTPADKAVFFWGDQGSEQVVSLTKARRCGYAVTDQPKAYVFIRKEAVYVDGQPVAKTSDIKLLGQHSRQNVCAAIAAVYDFLPTETASGAIVSALHKCQGFPSRLEPIAEINGVTYVNDSFASAPEASIAALDAIKGPKVLIVGGHDKGANMQQFADKIVVSEVKHLIIIGVTGDKIAELVTKHKPELSISRDLPSMKAIVADAAKHASAGDSVLLSTGSASFGMFKNVFDRAEQFKQAVATLKQ